jgi:DNA-directed RNA polymerase specialized sigma24 family protein
VTEPRAGSSERDVGPTSARSDELRRAALSDVELWRQAVEDRDGDAYALLYDRHARHVATFVARRLGPDEAEDVTAEVFLEAWRQRDHLTVEDESGLAPWLIAVARNMTAARSKQLLRQRQVTAGSRRTRPSTMALTARRSSTGLRPARTMPEER